MWKPPIFQPQKKFNAKCGIYGFNFDDKLVISDGKNYRINFEKLLVCLFPGRIPQLLNRLNGLIRDRFQYKIPRRTKKIHPITEHEFNTISGPVQEIVNGSNVLSTNYSSDVVSALSTPAGTKSMDSFCTFSTRTFIEVNKHKIQKTERKTNWEVCKSNWTYYKNELLVENCKGLLLWMCCCEAWDGRCSRQR